MGSALFAGMFVDDSATKNNRLGGVAAGAPSAWLVEFYCRLPACAGLSVLLAWLAMGGVVRRAGAATLHRGWRASLDAPVAAGTHFNTG